MEATIPSPAGVAGSVSVPLTAQDIIDGLFECYIQAHREIADQYGGKAAEADLEQQVQSIVGAVLTAQAVSAESLSRLALKQAITVLNADFNLAAYPDIYEAHHARIHDLLRRIPSIMLM